MNGEPYSLPSFTMADYNLYRVDDRAFFLFVAAALAFIFILILLSLFFGSIGRIGLVRGTQQAEQGAVRLSFGELFSGSLPYFWRVFGLNLLVGILGYADA